MGQESAMNRIEFVPFGADMGIGVLQELKQFRTSGARCYDPNEENRLKTVIKATGEEDFDVKIRKLAFQVEEHLGRSEERKSFKSPIKVSRLAIDAAEDISRAASDTVGR